jgi:undecaprenyl pyrophosphate phosphatase UppP
MSGVRVRPGAFFLFLALALAGAGIAAALVLTGEGRGAGAAVALAGGALLAARGSAGEAHRLVLLQAVAQRAAEAVVLGAIAWVALPGASRIAAAAITALGASYLATYLRVRAEGLGFRVSVPAPLQAVALFLVALGLVADQVEAALWAVAAFSAFVLSLEIVELGRRREPR